MRCVRFSASIPGRGWKDCRGSVESAWPPAPTGRYAAHSGRPNCDDRRPLPARPEPWSPSAHVGQVLPFANGRFPAGYVWVQAMGRTGSLSEHQKELAAALPSSACRKCLSDATVVSQDPQPARWLGLQQCRRSQSVQPAANSGGTRLGDDEAGESSFGHDLLDGFFARIIYVDAAAQLGRVLEDSCLRRHLV